MAEQIKYVSLERLGYYDGKIKAHIAEADKVINDALDAEILRAKGQEATNAAGIEQAQTDIATLAGKVGAVPEGSTVMGIIQNIQESAYDDTELRGLVTANKDAIDGVKADYLKGSDKTELSGLITAEKERAEGVEAGLEGRIETMEAFWEAAQADGTDSNVIDTLKEIQEYIVSDETGAAEMAASIKQNSDSITALEGRMGTAEGNLGTLSGRVDAIETLDEAFDERIEALESAVGESGSVATDIETAKGEAISAAAADAKAKADQALVDAKAYADEEDAKIEERVSALETASGTHALASDLNTLAGRVTTVEGKVTTLEGEMDAVEALAAANKAAHEANAAAIALKASQADLEAEVARATGRENELQEAIDAFVECTTAEIDNLFN